MNKIYILIIAILSSLYGYSKEFAVEPERDCHSITVSCSLIEQSNYSREDAILFVVAEEGEDASFLQTDPIFQMGTSSPAIGLALNF